MIKICVAGSKGKMGLRIIELAKKDKELEVVSQFDLNDDPEVNIKACDCLIDFTTPEASIAHILLCKRYKKAIVIGTTGFSDAQKAEISDIAKKIPVVFSPNMSIGVNLLFKLLEEASKILDARYKVKIKEAHHIHKKDAPSGTAKECARIIKDMKGLAEIPIESIREGEIVGDHTITFEGPHDVLEITHSAKTRDVFAHGALNAAKFAVKQLHGLFNMQDVLKSL